MVFFEYQLSQQHPIHALLINNKNKGKIMKKYLYVAIFLLGFANTSHAEKGINIGLSLAAGVFETSAIEKEGATAGIEEKTEHRDAAGAFGIGSIFIEKEFPNDRFAVGIDYVPYALESESSTHEQTDLKAGELEAAATTGNNTAQVDFEHMLTLYAKVNLTDNLYAKIGAMQVEAITNEKMHTGSRYPDKTLNGMTFGMGYEHDFANNAFVRVEASYMELGGETFKSTTNTDNTIIMSDITGAGAKLSIGKSF